MEKAKAFVKRFQYNSPVILSFTLLSFLALILSYVTARPEAASDANTWLFSVYRTSFGDILGYLRLFFHVLGHANIEHFFGNFVIILLMGPMLEEKYGSKNMLFMMLFTALLTGLLSILLFPTVMLLGASGIAFMLMLLGSYVNISKGRIPLTLVLCVVVFIGREIVSGVTELDNISNISHIVGGICGAAFGYLLNIKKFRIKLEAIDKTNE